LVEVSLTQGRIAIIDDEDWDLIKDYKWFAFKMCNTYYAVTNYYKEDRSRKLLLMHRLILDAQPGQRIDHKNRNGCDNRKENLRFASVAENAMNKESHTGTSIYKGVCWDRGKWKSSIATGRKSFHLGRFVSEKEAAKAYDKKAIELFGDFAKLNIQNSLNPGV
jgi:hypothetical protein